MTENDRPEFARVRLDLTVDEGVGLVHRAVRGRNAADTGSGVAFRTDGGMLVAVVSPAEEGTRPEYRTTPPTTDATRKGRKIRNALGPVPV